jgi:glycosyltransferase involved in cell wall biosynthesis
MGVGDGGALLVSASRLAPQKALHVLIAALDLVPGAVLVILGEGPLRDELETKARGLGVSDRVKFLGFRPDVADFVAAADAFCLSSVWEGVPLSAQEAILLNTPVVATRVGGMPELLVDGESGLLVEPNDLKAFAAAIERVMGDDAFARRLASAAQTRLRETFSTERMLERLTELYTEGRRAV